MEEKRKLGKLLCQIIILIFCSLSCVISRISLAQSESIYIDVIEPSTTLSHKSPGRSLDLLRTYKQDNAATISDIDRIIVDTYIGKRLLEIGDYPSAKRLMDSTLPSSISIPEKEQIILLGIQAVTQSESGEGVQGIKNAHLALSKAISFGEPQLLAEIYFYVALTYSVNFNEVKSIEFLQKAFPIISHFCPELYRVKLQMYMANSYFYLRDIEKASLLTEHAISYYLTHEMYFDAVHGYQLQSSIFRYQENSEQAIYVLNKAVSLFDYLTEKQIQYDVFLDLSQLYLDQSTLEKAKIFYKLAEQVFIQQEDHLYGVEHYLIKANIMILEDKMIEASALIAKTEEILKDHNKQSDVATLLHLYQTKERYAVNNNDFKVALTWQKKIRYLEESDFIQTRTDTRKKFKAMFETEQALLVNELSEQKSRIDEVQLKVIDSNKRLATVSISVLIFLIFILLLLIFRHFRRKTKRNTLDNVDDLTTLANRRFTLDQGALYYKQKSKTASFALITFDIDHFKNINERYGYSVGDSVLKHISDIGKDIVRKDDVLGRVGGQEFLITLPQATLTNAIDMAECLREAISQKPLVIYGKPIFISASFGVSAITENTDSFSELYHQADQALSRAKKNGRNQVVELVTH